MHAQEQTGIPNERRDSRSVQFIEEQNMTAPEANHHHNQHSVPTTFSLHPSESHNGQTVDSPSTKGDLTLLNQEVCDYYSASALQGIHTDDVLQFLSTAVSPMYVTGIKELVKTGEALGYTTELQFFRCSDRSVLAPVALTFKRVSPNGSTEYGLPNVTSILDSPEERLRGDNSASGKKLTRATDGTAEEREDATFGGKVVFETFPYPARVLISESTDTELHRPFDLSAQFSPEIQVSALATMCQSLTTQMPFSYLAECVVHPALTQFLSRYSQLFGARERAEIVNVDSDGNHTAIITVVNPEQSEGPPLSLRAQLHFSPNASVTISQIVDDH